MKVRAAARTCGFVETVLHQNAIDGVFECVGAQVDFLLHAFGFHRNVALVSGAAQAVDQIAAEIGAQRVAVGGCAFGAGVGVGMAGGEPQHLGEDELGDEFFLVVAERLQFERMIGAQCPLDQVDHRDHFVIGQLRAAAPQFRQDCIIEITDELAARYGAHENLRGRMGHRERGVAGSQVMKWSRRPRAARESEGSMVFASRLAYMD